MYTYQDLLEAENKLDFAYSVIAAHKSSDLYKYAVLADEYDRKQNRTILQYQRLLYTLSGNTVPDNYSANFKMGRAFLPFFVTQETQYLLGNGVTWKDRGTADKLGTKKKPFDTQLQDVGRKALVCGEAYGFFNKDHVDVFSVLDFAPLYDEETGALRSGVRFWQIDSTKPLRATLYEEDGYTDYIWRTRKKDGEIAGEILHDKRPYIEHFTVSAVDGMEITDGENYPGFPIIPLWGNKAHQSEFVGLQEKNDCYDLILSGFANTVDDASIIYWLIQNAGGMDDIDDARLLERLKTAHIAHVDDGQTIEAKQLDAPHESRDAILDRLEKDIYTDMMAFDPRSIVSGATVQAQIRAAYEPLNEKTDGFEYCVLEFINSILEIAGVEDDASFTRSVVVNVGEEIQSLVTASQYLPEDYVTRKILALLGDGDSADDLIDQMHADELERGGNVEAGNNEIFGDVERGEENGGDIR